MEVCSFRLPLCFCSSFVIIKPWTGAGETHAAPADWFSCEPWQENECGTGTRRFSRCDFFSRLSLRLIKLAVLEFQANNYLSVLHCLSHFLTWPQGNFSLNHTQPNPSTELHDFNQYHLLFFPKVDVWHFSCILTKNPNISKQLSKYNCCVLLYGHMIEHTKKG